METLGRLVDSNDPSQRLKNASFSDALQNFAPHYCCHPKLIQLMVGA